jgi:hypothetical protein
MEKIIKEEYERETYYYSDTTTTRTLDKKNNVVHLCATYARYFMCIIDTNTFQEEYFELTPEEFIAKEYELMGDTIYRISDIEFKDVQGFRDKLDAFKILFKSENVTPKYIEEIENKSIKLLEKIYYANHIFEYNYFKNADNYGKYKSSIRSINNFHN